MLTFAICVVLKIVLTPKASSQHAFTLFGYHFAYFVHVTSARHTVHVANVAPTEAKSEAMSQQRQGKGKAWNRKAMHRKNIARRCKGKHQLGRQWIGKTLQAIARHHTIT